MILAAFPVYYASIFAHELGHAVAGRLAGFVVTSFGMGTARPVCVVTVCGVRVYFCPGPMTQGITFAFIPQLYPSKAASVGFAAAGIVANGLLAALSLALLWRWLPWGGSVWPVVAALNGLLQFASLIPIRVRIGKAPLRTDGAALILHAAEGDDVRGGPRGHDSDSPGL